MIASCQTGVAVQCRTQLPGARCDIVGQMDDSCLWSGAREALGAQEFKIVWLESVRKSYSCSKVQKTNTSGSVGSFDWGVRTNVKSWADVRCSSSPWISATMTCVHWSHSSDSAKKLRISRSWIWATTRCGHFAACFLQMLCFVCCEFWSYVGM